MKSFRLRGLVVLLVTAAGSYFALAMPYAEARAGNESVWLTTKLIVAIPVLALVGLGMLAGGERFYGAIATPEHRLRPLGWVVAGVGIGVGFGLYSWFQGVLGAMGYGA
jgi:hypothetical protein